jgi:hypothetical protein
MNRAFGHFKRGKKYPFVRFTFTKNKRCVEDIPQKRYVSPKKDRGTDHFHPYIMIPGSLKGLPTARYYPRFYALVSERPTSNGSANTWFG